MFWTYLVAGLLALSALLRIGDIGKYREPITPASAIASVVLAAILIVGLLFGR